MDEIHKKYHLGLERALSVGKEIYSHFHFETGRRRNPSLNIALCSESAEKIIMFDMIVTLQQQVDILTKKIEEYEKQTLPVAELVEYEPVEYEPLFPILDPLKND